jgi:hypothetical protein
MRITIFWDNAAHTLLRIDFLLNWRWSDFEAALDASKALATNVEGLVDVIGNLHTGSHLPFSHLPRQLLQSARVPPDKLGVIVIVGASEASKDLLTAFGRIFCVWREKFLLVDTIEAARASLVQRRHERVSSDVMGVPIA